MRKVVIWIVLALIIPTTIYLAWTLSQDKPVMTRFNQTFSLSPMIQSLKALPEVQPTLFERIWSKLDRIGSSVSIILGIAVALKELHGSKKRKRKATMKVGIK